MDVTASSEHQSDGPTLGKSHEEDSLSSSFPYSIFPFHFLRFMSVGKKVLTNAILIEILVFIIMFPLLLPRIIIPYRQGA